jgi:hypothetical protein
LPDHDLLLLGINSAGISVIFVLQLDGNFCFAFALAIAQQANTIFLLWPLDAEPVNHPRLRSHSNAVAFKPFIAVRP